MTQILLFLAHLLEKHNILLPFDFWLLAFQFQSVDLNSIFLAWYMNRSLRGVLSIRLLYLGFFHYFCHWRACSICPKTLSPAFFSISPPCPKIVLQGKWKSSWAETESTCQDGPCIPGNSAPGKEVAADLWVRRIFVEQKKLKIELPAMEQMICERGNLTLSA